MTELERYTDYIRKHQHALNKSYIAKYIGISDSELHNAIHKKTNHYGNIVKIPKRCVPKLKAYFFEMSIDPIRGFLEEK